MKKAFYRSLRALLIAALLLACTFAFVACGDKESTVGQPEVYDVTLSVPAGESFGLAGVTHTLAYKATEGSAVTVSVHKNGAEATADDYTYTESTKGIVFKKGGQYVVFVTATKNTISYSGSIGLTVYEMGDIIPVVTIDLTRITVNTPMPLYTVQYRGGAGKGTETVTVQYSAGSDGTYADATASDYEVKDGVFTAKHGTGTYKVTVSVTDSNNGTASATKEITARATPEAITITPSNSLKQDGWNRVQSNSTVAIGYTVTGDVGEYDCVIEENADLTISASENGMVVETTFPGTYTVGVTYTHRGVTSVSHSIAYKLQVVDNVELAPLFGNDPFDGTYDYLIPSTGLMLYNDVYSPDGNTRLTNAQVTYSIADSNVTTSGGGALSPVCMNAGDNENFPFVYVPNFENNSAVGTVTVRMQATYQGYSAVAYKTFTMTECGGTNEKDQDNAKLQAYYKAVAPESAFTLNLVEGGNTKNAMEFKARQNSVITRDGIITQRDATWGIGCLGLISVGNRTTYQIDFKITRISGAMELNVGLRTGNFEGWADYIKFKAADGDSNKLSAVYDRSNNLSNVQKAPASSLPNINEYGVTYVRISRTGNTLKVEFADETPDKYYMVYSATVSGLTAKTPGAALNSLQFDHEGGCVAIEGVRVS